MRLLAASVALLLAFGSARAAAQMDDLPDDKMITIFAADQPTRTRLCGRNGPTVRPTVLLGELAREYSVNFFALPEVARLGARAIPNSVEARAIAWIIQVGPMSEDESGLEKSQFDGLNRMRYAFARYLMLAAGNSAATPYRTARSSSFVQAPPLGPPPRPLRLEEASTQDLLLAFFGEVIGVEPNERLVLACPPVRRADADAARPAQPQPPPPPAAGPPAGIAIRGQIDDLAARAGTDAFKKASSATLAFTDNNEAGTTSFAINGVLAFGTNVGTNNTLYGFVQYTLNDQETDAVGDADDAKDVHNISPGVFYRHPLALGRSFYGTLGLTSYATFDLRNDAQLVRARLLYSDIAIALPVGAGFLCGQERRLLVFYADCRLGIFLEAAEVLDAGTNTDLLADADDEYLGAGAEVGLILSPQGPAFLRPLSFRATYRRMAILSGALDDPQRLDLSLTYSSPSALANRQAYSFGISYLRGENFESFQFENLWKLTFGLKF